MNKDPLFARNSPEAHGRQKAGRGIFPALSKERYQTEVESWRHLQSQNNQFTMKRLREPTGRRAGWWLTAGWKTTV